VVFGLLGMLHLFCKQSFDFYTESANFFCFYSSVDCCFWEYFGILYFTFVQNIYCFFILYSFLLIRFLCLFFNHFCIRFNTNCFIIHLLFTFWSDHFNKYFKLLWVPFHNFVIFLAISDRFLWKPFIFFYGFSIFFLCLCNNFLSF